MNPPLDNPNAFLTASRLMAVHRLMSLPEWEVFWKVLSANFPLDESVFVRNPSGAFDPLDASKRDGQRDVLLFIRKTQQLPTPSADEATDEGDGVEIHPNP